MNARNRIGHLLSQQQLTPAEREVGSTFQRLVAEFVEKAPAGPSRGLRVWAMIYACGQTHESIAEYASRHSVEIEHLEAIVDEFERGPLTDAIDLIVAARLERGSLHAMLGDQARRANPIAN